MRLDIYGENSVRLWVRLDGGLELEQCGTHVVGVKPQWFEDEMHEVGLDDLIPNEREGWDEPRRFRYAMNYGLAPLQPFLVEINRPTYNTYHTMEGTEYDVDFDAEFIRAQPLDPLIAAKRWRDHFDALAIYEKEREAHREKLRRIQCEDTKAMFVRFAVYFGTHDRYWDEMCAPRGMRLSLVTSRMTVERQRTRRRFDWAYLAQGQSDEGDWDEAYRNLYANAVREGVTLTEKAIRTLRVSGP